MTFKSRKFTKDQFINAVKTSRSIRQVLTKLGVNVRARKNYAITRKRILDLELDISHFSKSGVAYKRGQKHKLEKYLVKNSRSISSHNLKLRLINENILKRECKACNLTQWYDKPVPLELNHIDGDHFNNELSNLELLCPNCHAFTPKYRGRGRKINIFSFGTSETVRKLLRFGKA